MITRRLTFALVLAAAMLALAAGLRYAETVGWLTGDAAHRAMQVLIGLGFAGVALAMALPNYMALLMVTFFALSFVGATQDIAYDAYAVEMLRPEEHGAAPGVRAIATPLACANTVVFKGSENCPRTHQLIVESFLDAGFPRDAIWTGKYDQLDKTVAWFVSCARKP